VSLVQQNINQELRLTGIVMTMFDPRTKLSEQVVEEVQRYFGDLVYDSIIPRTVRLSEAPGYGVPITVYDPRSKGAQTYRQLASEVARRPPPDEPMPVFDDLPSVVMPAVVDDSVIPNPLDEAELEALPVPTVHQLVEEDEVQTEVEVVPGPPPPVEEIPSPVGSEQISEPSVQAEPSSPTVDEDDVWEELDEPASDTPLQAPRGAMPRHTPPEHPSERRVVVIDENAELEAPSGPPPVRSQPEASTASSPGVAEIGATLEEDDQPKRRWRLFRKGGE